MINKRLYILGLPALALALAGCSDKWSAGPEVDATMGVYFGEQTAYSYEIEPDDNHILELTLGRMDGTEAATVALTTVSCPEGVKVPQSVTFAAGSKTATVSVDVTDMAPKTSGAVELKIDPAYTYTYAAGTSSVKLDILMTGAWIPVSDGLDVRYEDLNYNEVFPRQSTQLMILDGTYKFKIVDFMYSGLDLYFKFKDEDIKNYKEGTATSMELVPYKNNIDFSELYPEEDDDYGMWVFYNTDLMELPQWTAPGGSVAVDEAMFYSGKTYETVDFAKGTGKLRGTVDFVDETWSYLYIDFTFKANFDPFADWQEDKK